MAGIANSLQTELVNLSNDARKKWPDIKDAAERLIIVIRASKDKPSAELCEDLAKSEDTLRPFLLALDTKHAKLVASAMGCLQRLISLHAITEDMTAMHSLLKALGDVVALSSDIQLKVLQTILPLLSSYDSIHDDMLAERPTRWMQKAVLMCFKLQQSKDVMVNNTASATLRQLVIFLFDKVVKEDQLYEHASAHDLSRPLAPNSMTVDVLRPCAKDVYMLFQDLCLLSYGEPPIYLKLSSLQRTYGLELIESILSNHANIFLKHPQFTSLLKNKVCPLIIKTFSEKHDFPQTMRLMRVICIIVKHFSAHLIMECEVFLSMLLKTSEPDNPAWQRAIVMEIFRSFCADSLLIRSIFRCYDQQKHTTSVVHGMISVLNRLAAENSLASSGKASGSNQTSATGHGTSDSASHAAIAAESYVLHAGCIMRIPCMDQLDKSDPPPMPDYYFSLLSLQCLVLLIDGMHTDVLHSKQIQEKQEKSLQALESPDVAMYEANDCLTTTKEMLESGWHGLLAALSIFVVASVDDELASMIVTALQRITVVCGTLGMTTPRDAFITTICKYSLPGYGDRASSSAASMTSSSEGPSGGIGGGGGNPLGIITTLPSLTERNYACLSTLCIVAESLAATLDDAWLPIFETIQLAEHLIANRVVKGTTNHMQKKLTSQQSVAALTTPNKSEAAKKHSQLNFAAATATSSVNGGNIMEAEAVFAKDSKQLFDSSKDLTDDAFLAFAKALCIMTSDNGIAPAAVTAVGEEDKQRGGLPGNLFKLSIRTDEKAFAVEKLRETAVINIERIVHLSERAWTLIINQLIDVATQPANTLALRIIASEIVTNVTFQGMIQTDMKMFEQSEALQVKLLQPLRELVVLPLTHLASGASLDVPRRALETLDKMLQQQGQAFTSTWGAIFDILKHVCLVPVPRLASESESVGLETQNRNLLQTLPIIATNTTATNLPPTITPITTNPTLNIPPTPNSPSSSTSSFAASNSLRVGALVRVAFPCLQLICTDYLALLNATTLKQCIDALCTFAAQTDDLNVSLTAVRMLWSVSDYLQTKRQELADKSDPSNPSTTEATSTSETAISSAGANALWLLLLQMLLTVCGDARPEVRNGAVQSLLRAISNYGDVLTSDMWIACIRQIMFPLFDQIKRGAASAPTLLPAQTERSAPRLHHSRDSNEKQWCETKVTVLNGVAKVFHDFIIRLLLLPDFTAIWSLLLEYIQDFCMCGSNEVALTSIKCLKLLLSTKSSYASLPSDEAREQMLTVWRVTWAAWERIGLNTYPGGAVTVAILSQSSDVSALSLGHDTLTHFLQCFTDIYGLLRSELQLPEMKRLLAVLTAVLECGARVRDYPPDSDYLPPLQIALIECITQIDVEVVGVPSLVLFKLAELITLPLEWMPLKSNEAPSPTKKSVIYPTYLAMGRRVIRLVVEIFRSHVTLLDIYISGAFSKINSALGEVMKLKHDYPAQSKGDSSAFWKSATTSFLTVVTAGLSEFEQHAQEVPQSTTDSIYMGVVTALQDHILSKSVPPQSTLLDDLEVDEQFDISTVQSIQADLIQHLCKPLVSDGVLRVMITALERASRFYERNVIEDTIAGVATMAMDNEGGIPQTPLKFLPQSTPLSSPTTALVSLPTINAACELPVLSPNPYGAKLNGNIMERPVMREKYAAACLGILFSFVEIPEGTSKTMREDYKRLRVMTTEILLERCRNVIVAYGSDKPFQGRMPFSRIRDEEMLIILDRLLRLQLEPNTVIEFQTHMTTPLTVHLQALPDAHLFYLYPDICSCLATCGGTASDDSQIQVIKLLVACMRTCGQRLGVSL